MRIHVRSIIVVISKIPGLLLCLDIIHLTGQVALEPLTRPRLVHLLVDRVDIAAYKCVEGIIPTLVLLMSTRRRPPQLSRTTRLVFKQKRHFQRRQVSLLAPGARNPFAFGALLALVAGTVVVAAPRSLHLIYL